MNLREVVERLAEFDDDETIFVAGDSTTWDAESEAEVGIESEEGLPPSASTKMRYFLEVEVAREVAEVWSAWRGGKVPSADQLCKALVYYARNDTYLP